MPPKTTVKVKKLDAEFKDPAWSKASAKPGEEVELSVTSPALQAGEEVWFVLLGPDAQKLGALKADASFKAKWTVPNLAGETKVKFQAQLRAKPTPKNGHQTIRAKVDAGELTVQGFKIEAVAAKTDKAFCPKQEKVEVAWKVTDPGSAATKGRIEIYGERYPDPKPVYSEDWNPTAGETVWKTWDGKANTADGPLKNNLYITPEFSPYRVRVLIGTDDKAVTDPYKDGKGKNCIVEQQFEVKVESIQIKLMTIAGTVHGVNKATELTNLLAIEPRQNNGAYPHTGRFPLEQEPAVAPSVGPPAIAAAGVRPGKARIQVPVVRFRVMGEALDQGGLNRGDGYMSNNSDVAPTASPFRAGPGGAGEVKHTIEGRFYTRPEIPVEFEFKLTSRDAAKNTNDKGVQEKEATGPIVVEPWADEDYPDPHPLFDGGDATRRIYYKNAAFKIKKGAHDAMDATTRDGANPIISHWMARIKVANDGDRDFDLSTVDAAYKYTQGANELTVYLNKTKLVVGADGSKKDVEEEAGAGTKDKIKLKEKLTKKDDILWVIRTDSTGAVAEWKNFPPGVNCHAHYGGLRGEKDKPNNLWRKDYSADPAFPRVPIVGKGAGADAYGVGVADYPYEKQIKLNPDQVGANPAEKANPGGERVETIAVAKAGEKKLGLAGILFSPSTIAGDTYVLKAVLHNTPFERNFGCLSKKDVVKGKTGVLTVWRVARIQSSLRCPTQGTNGLTTGDAGAVDHVGGYPAGTNTIDVTGFAGAIANNRWFTIAGSRYHHVVTATAGGPPPTSITFLPALPAAVAHGAAISFEAVGNQAEEALGVRDHPLDGVNMDVHDMNLNLYKEAFTEWATTTAHGTDPHTDITVANYRTAHNQALTGHAPWAAFGYDAPDVQRGAVNIANAAGITNEFIQYEHFRAFLPPGTPAGRRRHFTHRVNALPTPTFSQQAMGACNEVLGGAWPQAAAPGIQIYPQSVTHYKTWLGWVTDQVKYNVLDSLTPRMQPQAPPTAALQNQAPNANDQVLFMNAVRWPHLYTSGGPGGGLPAKGMWVDGTPNPRINAPTGGYVEKGWRKLTGTIDTTGANTTVTGTGTAFTTELRVNDRIQLGYAPTSFNGRVSTIVSDTEMTVSGTPPALAGDDAHINDQTENVTSTFTTGFARGSGQSFFRTNQGAAGTRPDPTLFGHEMGHCLSLVHFAAGNLGWKHHDLRNPSCFMSYGHIRGWIPSPGGLGGPIAPPNCHDDTGWPDQVPAAALANPAERQWPLNSTHVTPNPPAGDPTIEITVLAKPAPGAAASHAAHGALGLSNPCAKCSLKMRGWKDDVLPCAWRHPDLF